MPLTNTDGVVFATVTTASYLPQAMIMAESVKKHMPRGKIIACIVEEKIPETTMSLDTYFDEVILAKNLSGQKFYQIVFQYDQAEACNACKAQLLLHLMAAYKNHHHFVFLDSDTKAFGPFADLMKHLETKEIILSPHFISFNEEDPLNQLRIIHTGGIFNTGFFAVKRGKEAYKFLHWWANILLQYCYRDQNKGLMNEQKWLDLAPGLFDFYIQDDPGYNIGPWNFHERFFTEDQNKNYQVNGKPFCLFHFSGLFNGHFDNFMKRINPRQRRIITGLKKEYWQEYLQANRDLLSKKPWSYGYFTSGLPIHKESRSIYRNNLKLYHAVDNPFSKDNQFFRPALSQHF